MAPLDFGQQLALGLAVALSASIITLTGNWLIQSSQSRRVVRAELREFVRALHHDTVATVADLDLFMREIRAEAILGKGLPGRPTAAEIVDEKWEGDLLRRLRLVEFGHPDPDVREAATQLEEDLWTYTTTATVPISSPSPTHEERSARSLAASRALAKLQSAVVNAPRRDVPK